MQCQCEESHHGDTGCRNGAKADIKTIYGTFRVCPECIEARCMMLEDAIDIEQDLDRERPPPRSRADLIEEARELERNGPDYERDLDTEAIQTDSISLPIKDAIHNF